jgi:hypothetical protein
MLEAGLIDMKWSKVYNTELGIVLRSRIEENTDLHGLRYHTMAHIASMYDYLDATGETWSEALDWAVLAHDVVYDNTPQKEDRSAEFFVYHASFFGLSNDLISDVVEMVKATIEHKVTTPNLSAIIRADLHQLTIPEMVITNYYLILQESVSLYGITQDVFASNNRSFLSGLDDRMTYNLVEDPDHYDFYTKVSRGINTSKMFSKVILNSCY